jgi:hypothetical protein
MQFSESVHAGLEILGCLLWHEMTAVRRRVNQEIVWLGGHPPIEDRFKCLVSWLTRLKREVIAKHHESLLLAMDAVCDGWKICEVVSIDLNQAQPLPSKLREAGAHQRGFSSTPRARHQNIIGGKSLHKMSGISSDLLRLMLNVMQIGKAHPGRL